MKNINKLKIKYVWPWNNEWSILSQASVGRAIIPPMTWLMRLFMAKNFIYIYSSERNDEIANRSFTSREQSYSNVETQVWNNAEG